MKACRLSRRNGTPRDVQYSTVATAVVARNASTGASSGSRTGAPSAEFADGGAGTMGGPAQILVVVQRRDAAGAQRRQQRVELPLEVGDRFAAAAQGILQAVAPQGRAGLRSLCETRSRGRLGPGARRDGARGRAHAPHKHL